MLYMITSKWQGVGKSSTAMRLYDEYSSDKKKVIIVDADLRGSKNIGKHTGLSDYLVNDIPLSAIFWRDSSNRLFISPGLNAHWDATNLLSSTKYKELLFALNEEFDCVLIDTTPYCMFSDAVIISYICDGVVLIGNASDISDANKFLNAPVVRIVEEVV